MRLKTPSVILTLAFFFILPGAQAKKHHHYKPKEPEWHLQAELKDQCIKVYYVDMVSYDREADQYVLVWENGNDRDTICFRRGILGGSFPDSCRLSSAQVDSQGREEVMITWYEGHGSVCYVKEERADETLSEVWSFDTHTKLFSAMPRFVWSYKDEEGGWKESHCSYSYDMTLNGAGHIIIHNLQKNYDKNCDGKLPDHEMGEYIFRGGQFVLDKK